MILYIVEQYVDYPHDWWEIESVWSSKEKAEKHIQELNIENSVRDISIFELDK